MCGRYTLHHSTDQITMRFGVSAVEAPSGGERFNIAPTQAVAAVTLEQDKRELDAFRWGLIPSWAKDPAIGNRMINARAETVAEKPAFRTALDRRRCLIPSDGFYEWQAQPEGRQPMHIRRRDGELFAFAGLWEEWRDETGTPLRTCTIITTTPNDVMLPIHNRMPAILLPEHEAAWLDTTLARPADVLSFLAPYPNDLLEAFPVSKQVNSPTNDGPTCVLATANSA